MPYASRKPMETVQVEIFGQKYSIRSAANTNRILELAAHVDATMKDIQKATGTMEAHRVAILAALTISEELHRLREQGRVAEKATEHALERLMELTAACARHQAALSVEEGSGTPAP